MKKQKIAFGPGASSLMLIVVVLALSVLAVLTMFSARNDETLSQRSLETRKEVYGLFAGAERSLAKLDAVAVRAAAENPGEWLKAVEEDLPEGMRIEGDQVFWEEKAEDRMLECAVRLHAPGGGTRTTWTLHRLGEADIWENDFGNWDEADDTETTWWGEGEASEEDAGEDGEDDSLDFGDEEEETE